MRTCPPIRTSLASAQRRQLWLPALLSLLCALPLSAQNVPVISGAIGYLNTTNAGSLFFQAPILAPTVTAPLGKHFLAESRFDFREFFGQVGNKGDYLGTFFKSTQYLQLDAIVSPHLTIVGGRFLTPFGTYNERQTPIWIQRLPDAPMVFAIGTRTGAAGNGGEIRGVVFSRPKVQLNYTGYFSGRSSISQFQTQRATGGRGDLYFPTTRVEIGASYARALQGVQYNSWGTHFWWLPKNSQLQVRSEYAHGPHAQGYWIEVPYRLSRFGSETSFIGRAEPVFRMQQIFRNSPSTPGQSDALPAVDTQQADFGLDYHLDHEVRLNTSYSRKFASTGNSNIWDVSLTYRFLFPAWRSKK
jgi:hypothetical protein